MNDKQVIALARIAIFYARLESMKAANQERINHGLALAYPEQAFESLPQDCCVDEPQIKELLGW